MPTHGRKAFHECSFSDSSTPSGFMFFMLPLAFTSSATQACLFFICPHCCEFSHPLSQLESSLFLISCPFLALPVDGVHLGTFSKQTTAVVGTWWGLLICPATDLFQGLSVLQNHFILNKYSRYLLLSGSAQVLPSVSTIMERRSLLKGFHFDTW